MIIDILCHPTSLNSFHRRRLPTALSPFHTAGITDPTQPYGTSKHTLPAIRKVCVHLTDITAERILVILHFRCCDDLSGKGRVRMRYTPIIKICNQTTWPTPFPRGLPSLDILFRYGKRIVYRILVQNVYSSDRSFTKNIHNHNTYICWTRNQFGKAGVRLLLRTPCSSVQHWSFGWEFAYIFTNCCNARQIFPQLSPIFPMRNVPKHCYKHIFLVQRYTWVSLKKNEVKYSS